MKPTIFENVDCALKIMLHELTAVRPAATGSGEHTRLGGGIDDPIGGWQCGQILAHTHVGVNDANASLGELAAIQFASGAKKIINAKDFQTGFYLAQSQRQSASGKSADACDENLHTYLADTCGVDF